jgi:hypothetical protein
MDSKREVCSYMYRAALVILSERLLAPEQNLVQEISCPGDILASRLPEHVRTDTAAPASFYMCMTR